MKMTVNRMLIFLSFMVMIGLIMQQCWQSKSASEKWLYFFGESARDYAGHVLGPGETSPVRGTLHNVCIIIIFTSRRETEELAEFT